MRLLIINDHGIYCGGTETRIRIFVEALLQMPFCEQIHVLQYENIQPFQHPKLFYHSATPSPYYATKQIIQNYKIDLVQVHNLFQLHPYLLLAAKHTRIPIVWWAHDYWLLCAKRSFIDPFNARHEELCKKASRGSCHRCMNFKTQLKYWIWQRIMNFADMAIAPSYILQQIHEKNNILQKKWNVVTPWIDPYYFEYQEIKQKKKEKILLFIGSLVEFKGAWVAARALKKIVQHFPETKLIFVGSEQEPDFQYRKDIEKICEKDKTLEHILFLGRKNKEEIAALYAEANIYLCPTVCMESFGLTWAEAMASGCPVIASAIGSIPEYIKSYETGLLFTPRDHEGLAKQVLTLFSNPYLTKKIGNYGKAYAQENFSVKKSTEIILKLYLEKLKI